MRGGLGALALMGATLGAMVVASRRSTPIPGRTDYLRERTIEAQEIAMRAARIARELAMQWSEAQAKEQGEHE